VTSRHFDIAIIGSGIAGGALGCGAQGQWFERTAFGPSFRAIGYRQRRPYTAGNAALCCPAGACWIGCWKRVPSGERERAGLMRRGAHVVTVPVPQRDDCAGAFLFLNHEKIGDILLDTGRRGGSCEHHRSGRLVVVASSWELACRLARQLSSRGRQLARCLWLPTEPASTVRSRLKMGLDRHRYQYPIAVLYGPPKGPCAMSEPWMCI
jgi:hypothetical protein